MRGRDPLGIQLAELDGKDYQLGKKSYKRNRLVQKIMRSSYMAVLVMLGLNSP